MGFDDVEEGSRAYRAGKVGLQAKVKVHVNEVIKTDDGEFIKQRLIKDTTVGRALLYEIVPDGLPYELINRTLGNKDMSSLINTCYRTVGLKATVI